MNIIDWIREYMANSKEMRDSLNLADRATLSMLSALESDEPITQRGLASRIGVALGFTNSLLKRAALKGLVKVSQAPAKRFAYYVTPKGFSEKSRLVAEYLSSSLDFFRQAREEFTLVYDAAQACGHTRVALFGAGELAEIATLSALDSGIKVLAVIHPGSSQTLFSGLPVFNSWALTQGLGIDAVVITSIDAPQAAYEFLREHYKDEQIFAAPMLHVTRSVNGKGKQ